VRPCRSDEQFAIAIARTCQRVCINGAFTAAPIHPSLFGIRERTANPFRDYSVVLISHDFHLSPVCSGFRWLVTLSSAQEWRITAILVEETGTW